MSLVCTFYYSHVYINLHLRKEKVKSYTFFSAASPSAPKDLKVAEVTRKHVHLMWEAPDHDGGSPITGYQVEKREVSRKTWVKV